MEFMDDTTKRKTIEIIHRATWLAERYNAVHKDLINAEVDVYILEAEVKKGRGKDTFIYKQEQDPRTGGVMNIPISFDKQLEHTQKIFKNLSTQKEALTVKLKEEGIDVNKKPVN